MKKLLIYAIVTFVLSIGIQSTKADMVPLSGSVSTDLGSITATGDWAADGTSMSWEITPIENYFRYSYTFLSVSPAVSHFIIEVSENFTRENIWNVEGASSIELKTHYSQDSGNPSLPEDVYGIKFEGWGNSTTRTISFYSDRVPVWGDFYAKGGTISAWNSGFGILDGAEIAVPDSDIVVPVPSAALLGIIGVAAAGIKLRKFA